MKRILLILFILLLPLVLQAKVSHRIVSLAPSVTQALIELNLEHQVVGITEHCPKPNIQAVLIGNAFALNVEVLLQLNPDVVVGIENFNSPKHKQRLRALGCNVIYLPESRSWDNLESSFVQLATLFNKEALAHSQLRKHRATLAHISQQINTFTNNSYFLQISTKPLMSIGTQSYLTELLNRLRMTNIFDTVDQHHFQTHQESVIEHLPQWVIDISLQNNLSSLKKQWHNLSKISSSVNYLVLTDKYLSLPTPRSYIMALNAFRTHLKRGIPHVAQAN